MSSAAAPDIPDVADPPVATRPAPVDVQAAAAALLRIDFAREPLVSLRHGVTAAVRIVPAVTETLTGRVIPARTLARLSDAELAVIDRATLDHAGARLAEMDGPRPPPLILPVSFRTMAAGRGRQALRDIAAPERLKTGVILELVDIGPGTPPGRLVEVAGLLRTLCRGVFGRAQPDKDIIELVRDGRFSGLTLDVAELGGGDTRIASHLLEFGRLARGMARVLAAQGLAEDGFLAVAETAGLTHASLRAAPATPSS